MTFDVFFGFLNQSPMAGNRIYAQVLYAQAVHETGNFTSNLYKNYNNLFGMKPSRAREKYYNSEIDLGSETFASYDMPLKSVLDRIDLDVYNNVAIPFDVEDVVPYMEVVLRKGYATDPQYLGKWVNTLRNVGNDIGGSGDDDEFDDIEEQKPRSNWWKWSIFILLGSAIIYYFWKRRKSRSYVTS